MSSQLAVVLVLGALLAYANGANDVAKGIATLVGSGIASYRRAILWGTLWTGLGGLAGAFVGNRMVIAFGKGLLADGVVPTVAAAAATVAGAALWVMLATRTGLPVSTTHAIVGSIAGVAAVAYGWSGLKWAALVGNIGLPLLLSPVLAWALTIALLRLSVTANKTVDGADCICAELTEEPRYAPATPGGAALAHFESVNRLDVLVAKTDVCAREEPWALQVTLNQLHWLTSGATAFARGLNDGPKIVALLLAAGILLGREGASNTAIFVFVTLSMVAGSWIAGRRVTLVLAERITEMDHREGFFANLVTSLLVGPGAALGLPMSTTHVASAAIMGVGTQRGSRFNRKVLREIFLAWTATVPGAALLGVVVYLTLRLIGVA